MAFNHERKGHNKMKKWKQLINNEMTQFVVLFMVILLAFVIYWCCSCGSPNATIKTPTPLLPNAQINLSPKAIHENSILETAYGIYQQKVSELIQSDIKAHIASKLLDPQDRCVEVKVSIQVNKGLEKIEDKSYFARYMMESGKLILHNDLGFICSASPKTAKKTLKVKEFAHVTDKRGNQMVYLDGQWWFIF